MSISAVRQLVQFLSTLLSNSYLGTLTSRTLYTGPLKGVCTPILNCYACPSAYFSCPIGTLQHFMTIQTLPLYLLGSIVLVAMTTGRLACGWLCPFGLVQDLMYKIRSVKKQIPQQFKYLKYVVLVSLVMVIPWQTGETWFSKLCPAGTLFAGIPWVLWNPVRPDTGQLVLPQGPGAIFSLSLGILIVFLLWFVVSKRPFCRLFCPMGALLALFSKFSLVQLENVKGCYGCHGCEDVCPVDLDIEQEFDSEECVKCLDCTKCGHVKLSWVMPVSEKERWDG